MRESKPRRMNAASTSFPWGWWESRGVADVVSTASQPWGFKRWNTSILKWAGQERGAREVWKTPGRPCGIWFRSDTKNISSPQSWAQHRPPGANTPQGWKAPLLGTDDFPQIYLQTFFPFIFFFNSNFLVMTWSICDLSSSTRDQTHIPCFGSAES